MRLAGILTTAALAALVVGAALFRGESSAAPLGAAF